MVALSYDEICSKFDNGKIDSSQDIKGSLRPQCLRFKNDKFICTDSQKHIKTNKFNSINYLNLIL